MILDAKWSKTVRRVKTKRKREREEAKWILVKMTLLFLYQGREPSSCLMACQMTVASKRASVRWTGKKQISVWNQSKIYPQMEQGCWIPSSHLRLLVLIFVSDVCACAKILCHVMQGIGGLPSRNCSNKDFWGLCRGKQQKNRSQHGASPADGLVVQPLETANESFLGVLGDIDPGMLVRKEKKKIKKRKRRQDSSQPVAEGVDTTPMPEDQIDSAVMNTGDRHVCERSTRWSQISILFGALNRLRWSLCNVSGIISCACNKSQLEFKGCRAPAPG